MSYVLFDVDGCLVDLYRNPMPGIERLITTLRLLGLEIRVWSGGGEEWAAEAAALCGAPEAKCYRKPDYPITLEAASELLGTAPRLQIDDDPTERVADWPFMLIEGSGVTTRGDFA